MGGEWGKTNTDTWMDSRCKTTDNVRCKLHIEMNKSDISCVVCNLCPSAACYTSKIHHCTLWRQVNMALEWGVRQVVKH